MKKQAILILAHKDIDQLIKLCERLTPYFNVYVHIDRKTQIGMKEKEKLTSLDVQWWSMYDINWGSSNIVLATVMLMKKALGNENNSYFHLISGQDWPMEDPVKIYEDFINDQNIYMNYFKAADTEKSGENLIWWVKYYFNYNQINRRSLFGKIYHRVILYAQRIISVNKLKKYGINQNTIYAGEEWVDVPRDALQYALERFEENKNLQRVFANSFCPDEMWLQTILCNSPFRNRINKNIHRYINWINKHGSYPAILDDEDLEKIKNGDYWWGRKISMPISNNLIQKLDKLHD